MNLLLLEILAKSETPCVWPCVGFAVVVLIIAGLLHKPKPSRCEICHNKPQVVYVGA